MVTQQAFDGLLICLDSDRQRAAEKYEILRCKLVKFFEWRACAVLAVDLADGTIDRVARRIEEGEQVQNVSNYAYGVARMVYLENLRELNRADEARGSMANDTVAEGSSNSERLNCFE